MLNKKVYLKNVFFFLISILSLVILASCPQSIDGNITDDYLVGDIGPAGGLIFYDDNLGYDFDGDDEIESNEKNLMSENRYLEAAPSDYDDGSDNPYYHLFGYTRDTPSGDSQLLGTSSDIGSGNSNTNLLVSNSPFYTTSSSSNLTTTNSYAAKLCYSFSYNNYDDWFLPSEQELKLMHLNLHMKGLGNFKNAYWSSTEASANTVYVRLFNINENNKYTRDRNDLNLVRPIRAF